MRNTEKKRKFQLVPVLVIIPILTALALQICSLPPVRNLLPFGYAYQVNSNGKLERGYLPVISSERTQALLPPGESGDIRLAARVWSSSARLALVHLSPLLSSTLVLNGEPVVMQLDANLHPLQLKRGWNKLVIFHRIGQSENSRGCKFFFRVTGWTDLFIHMRTVPPGRPFVTVLSHLLRIIVFIQLPIALLALLLILASMVPVFRQHSAQITCANGQKSGFSLIFRMMLRIVALFIIIFHLIGQLRLFTFILLVIGCIIIFLNGFLWRNRSGTDLHWRLDSQALLVFVLALLLTSLFIFFIIGSIFPFEPTGGIDLINHLTMIKHIEQTGETIHDGIRRIYPQGSHGLLIIVARFLGRSPEEILTPISILLFAGIILLLYLFSRQVFGLSHPVWFFGALALVYFPKLLDSLFVWSSFPAFFSFFFFFSALLFFFSGNRMDTILALTAATAIYPFFFGIYILIFFLIMASPGTESLRQFCRSAIRTILFLLPAIVIALIYFKDYISIGMVASHLKSINSQILNPFDALEPVGVFLILCGLYFFIRQKKQIPVLIAAGLVGGFLIYYIPYRLFNLFGTYYIIKLVFFLFFWTIVFGANALYQIHLSQRISVVNKTCLILVLFTLAWWTNLDYLTGLRQQYREHHVSINLPGRPYRGMIPICNWITATFPAGKPIHLISINYHLRELLEAIMGESFPVSRKLPNETLIRDDSLLLVERDSVPEYGISPEWREIYRCQDFTIYAVQDW